MPYPVPDNMPVGVRIDIIMQAQDAALAAIADHKRDAARLGLFWVTFNTEMRRLLERWVRLNANIKT